MNDTQIPSLSSATRRAPLSFCLSAMFGGLTGQIGWGVFGFGMIFMWVLGCQADLSSFQYRGEVVTTVGRVTSVKSGNLVENKDLIYACAYQYVGQDGKAREGTSYTKTPPAVGSSVMVESPAGNPEISRIEGMRASALSPWAVLVGIIPLVGLLMAGKGIKEGLRRIHLFKSGRLVGATLKSMDETNERVNGRCVYVATLSFTADDGKEYETTVKTADVGRISDDVQEQLLYDPKRPAVAVPVDMLPGQPKFDAASNVKLHWSLPFRALALTLLPVLTVGINAYVAYGKLSK